MADTTLPGVFLKGIASARPAANAVAAGAVYSATDTGVITQSDGASTWTTWATISAGMTNPMTTQDDLIVGGTVTGGVAAPARLGKGSDGQVLTVDPSTHHLVWATPSGGADLVQVASGAGSVVIPSLKGSPLAVPASPNAADQEWGSLSGGTTIGTLDTLNVTDFLYHLHMKRTNVAVHGDGYVWTLASLGLSMPFTVTLYDVDINTFVNYNSGGLMLGEAAPGKFLTFGQIYNNGWPGGAINNWTNASTLAGATNTSFSLATWWKNLRAIVHSSTNIDFQISEHGYIWVPISTGFNPGFTVGSVGIGMSDSSASGTIEMVTGPLRFT